MRENNLYPFGGDPVRKLNRNPGTGKGMKTGMGMRMYATGERNKLRADALTSRRTVFPIAHVRTQLPPSPKTFDSTSLCSIPTDPPLFSTQLSILTLLSRDMATGWTRAVQPSFPSVLSPYSRTTNSTRLGY